MFMGYGDRYRSVARKDALLVGLMLRLDVLSGCHPGRSRTVKSQNFSLFELIEAELMLTSATRGWQEWIGRVCSWIETIEAL